MTLDSNQNKSSGNIIYSLLSVLLGEWQSVLSVGREVYAYFTRDRSEGLFEVLEYDDTLELMDPKGEVAIFRRRVKVKYLHNNVIAFQDYAWGDGNQLADYKISPGHVVDKYKEGGRWNLLVSLRETKNRGDVAEYYIERKVKNGFTKEVEWRQTEIWLKFDHIRLSIVFPTDRLCKRAVLVERSTKRTTPLGQSNFSTLPDGRQILIWEKDRPRRSEVYTIRWEW
jgi:hypothetical protein